LAQSSDVPAADVPTPPPGVSTTPPVAIPPPQVSTTLPTSKVDNATMTVSADGTNTYIGQVYTADDNVVVHDRGDVIFCDHMIYDSSTHVMIATGNARIFTADGKVYRGDSLTYNLDTKAITSTHYQAADYPRFLTGKQVTTPETTPELHYHLVDASFTTSNREHPSFHMHAGTIEYRPNDEVVLKNVIVYVGSIPVFYLPILVQSLQDSRPTYQFEIGDSGQFGYFMNNCYNWVASDQLRGSVEFDLRENRGFAGGVDMQYFPSSFSDMVLKTYYAQDNLYSMNNPAVPNAPARGDITDHNAYDGVSSDNRFRVTFQQYLQFDDNLSSTANINVWSDPWVTRDFFPGEYQQQNQPPNFISFDQYNPNFTMGVLAAPQANPFFQTVVRLPELSLESKQQNIFGLPIQYTSQSSLVNFEMRESDLNNFLYPNDYPYNSYIHQITAYDFYHPNAHFNFNTAQDANYSAYRYDTYHEFAYPHQYFGFLNLTPRIGGRFTYYSDNNDNLDNNATENGQTIKYTHGVWRIAGDAGLSGDFKLSRTWLDIKNPNLGIDGIRHVIEPYFDSAFAPSPTVTPNQFRGFDNRLYSTQLQPLDWTDYNSIDSIDKEAVVRVGVWNKIQTKRDGVNQDLLTINTYADADFDNNFDAAVPGNPGSPAAPAVGTPGTPGYIQAKREVPKSAGSTFSNLFNDVRYNVSQQFSFQSLSSLALDNSSYNEIDNSLTWAPDPSTQLTLSDAYLNHSEIFGDSNQVSMQLFYRLNEHWQLRAQEQFDALKGHLQLQQYTIYRDLDAWQLALTYADSEYNGQSDHSIFFSLTLKAFPKYTIHTPEL
jgi:LPS-assembly protein